VNIANITPTADRVATERLHSIERVAHSGTASFGEQALERVEGAPRATLATPTANIDRKGKLYGACRDLETFMLKIVVSGMRKTVEKSALSDNSFAGEIYEDMLYDNYTKSIADNAGFGFADMAYLELTGQRGKVINHKV
jgi:flagellar protein FlgJ